jgi:hypothetical protein
MFCQAVSLSEYFESLSTGYQSEINTSTVVPGHPLDTLRQFRELYVFHGKTLHNMQLKCANNSGSPDLVVEKRTRGENCFTTLAANVLISGYSHLEMDRTSP